MPAVEMVQMNMRVPASDKRRTEDVLGLLDTSLTRLVRGVLAKVARGAQDAEEVLAVIEDDSTVEDEASRPSKSSQLFERLDEQFASAARRLEVDPSLYVPLTDEELQEARYEDYLDKERERMVWPHV